ncbi:MAG TPA: Nif3-like dinuclear metal center hexameric protein [Anaerolineae bacterium]|nr:Nif3-like dinuclear metal center hexameric protein [Anaerolineae bacterium]
MKRDDIVAYLDEYLQVGMIADYGPQGLQVETDNDEIKKIALAVDSAPAVIEAAAAWGADMLLVHHGILWREVEKIAGPLGRRVRLMMKSGVNLYAAHLPLDAHSEVGNNAVLAEMFGVEIREWWCAPRGTPLAVIGELREGVTVGELAMQVEAKLNTQARVVGNRRAQVKTLAILSGFGADQVGAAQALGADTFLTGETSHANYWAGSDYGVNVIFGGHYATETVGVQALGAHLVDKFGLETKFFDFPTGM